MSAKCWSLASELNALECALRGVVILAQQIEEHRDEPAAVAQIAAATAAILSLAFVRVRDINRVLHADSAAQAVNDIARLHSQHNAVNVDDQPDAVVAHGGDVLFVPDDTPRPRRR